MTVLPVKCTYTARRPSVSSVASSGPGAEDVQPSLSLHADPVQASTLSSLQVQGKVSCVSFHSYLVTEGSALTPYRPPPSTHRQFKVWRRPSCFIPTIHWPPRPPTLTLPQVQSMPPPPPHPHLTAGSQYGVVNLLSFLPCTDTPPPPPPPTWTHCRFKVWRCPSHFIPPKHCMHWPSTLKSPQVQGMASSISFHSYHVMEGSALTLHPRLTAGSR